MSDPKSGQPSSPDAGVIDLRKTEIALQTKLQLATGLFANAAYGTLRHKGADYIPFNQVFVLRDILGEDGSKIVLWNDTNSGEPRSLAIGVDEHHRLWIKLDVEGEAMETIRARSILVPMDEEYRRQRAWYPQLERLSAELAQGRSPASLNEREKDMLADSLHLQWTDAGAQSLPVMHKFATGLDYSREGKRISRMPYKEEHPTVSINHAPGVRNLVYGYNAQGRLYVYMHDTEGTIGSTEIEKIATYFDTHRYRGPDSSRPAPALPEVSMESLPNSTNLAEEYVIAPPVCPAKPPGKTTRSPGS